MAYALFDGHSLKSITLQDTAAWQQFFGLGQDGPLTDVLSLYRAVPWLYRGVTLRANAVSAMPYTFAVGEDDLPPKDVIGTPRLPVDFDLPGVLRQFELWLTLFGRAYAHKEINGLGRATTLKPMLPATITPMFTPAGLAYFERQVNGQKADVAADQVFYVWYPAAGAEQGPGESPAGIAQGAAASLLNKENTSRAFFKRGGIKPTLISIPERTNDNDRDRLQGWLDRTISGLTGAFKAKLWRGEIKATEIGPDPDKLALRETTDMSREDTAGALGIPQSLIAANASNFATSQQDVRTFHDWTVIPEAALICAALNKQVFAPFGLTLRPRPDLMEMYQDDKSEEVDKLVSLVETGGLTINELRGMLDLGELTPQQIADNLTLLRMLFAAKNPPPAGYAQIPGETPVVIDSTATVSQDGAPVNIDSTQGLNGAQIQAALNILAGVVNGATVPSVAVELLMTLGIEPERAKRMVQDTAHGAKLPELPGSKSLAESKESLAAMRPISLEDDLGKWQQKAIRRWNEGKPEKALDFVSEAIPGTLAAAIRGGLEAATSEADIRAAFTWGAYP